MGDSIDMSLDDIIKKGKIKGGGGGKRFGGRREGAGGARNSRRPFGGQSGPGRRAPAASAPYQRGDVDGNWTHDLFDGPRRGASFVRREGGGGGGGGGSSAKLNISNLDFEVLDSDIYELFSEFGHLKKAAVHFDRSGRSLGTAEVIFEKRSDAVRAMKQYDNVPLDGREMNIQLADDEGARAPRNGVSAFDRIDTLRRSSGGRVDKFNRRRREGPGPSRNQTRNEGRRGGNRGGGGGDRRPQVSKEDLDKELDAYLSSR